MNNSDRVFEKQQRLEICLQHNQPILSYDRINKPQCKACLIVKSIRLFSEKIQYQLSQALFKNEILQMERQRQLLLSFQASVIDHKQGIIDILDMILKIVMEKIKSIDEQKAYYLVLCQNNTQQLCSQQLERELVNTQKNNIQFIKLTTYKLQDLYQKTLNTEHLNQYICENPCLKQRMVATSSTERKIDINEGKMDQQQILRKFEYQLTKEQTIKLKNQCSAFAFNYNSTRLVVGCLNEILVCEFINGRIINQVQRLSQHTQNVTCLYYMKRSNSFISGSSDDSIIIWSPDYMNQWFVKQIIKNHEDMITFLQMNRSENLLISGSIDKQVKFWSKQKDIWSCQQSIKLSTFVISISLNEMENILIFSGNLAIIYVMELQNNNQWSLVQEVEDCYGFRLSFTIGNQFAFQPFCKDYLEIFDFDQGKKQLVKISQVKILKQDNCHFHFPAQYIKSLNILTIKNGKHLNIFKINQDGQYQLMQSIEFQNHQLFGRMSDNGEYIVTWDQGSMQIQLRKLTFLE